MAAKYKLVKTCNASPEQYDVYKDDKQVAYIRVRHGIMRVDVPNCGGETVYRTLDFQGNGSFSDPKERDYHIKQALKAVEEYDHKLYEIEDQTNVD